MGVLEPHIQEAVLRIVFSFLAGAAIGYEREKKLRSAGLRTFALICLGSTLAMLVSIYVPSFNFVKSNNPGDPGRIAAQVLTGVGFLGAGAIIRTKGSVQGLTTAAGIWVSAVIGLAIGAGQYTLSVCTLLTVLFILTFIERIEIRNHVGGYNKLLELQFSERLFDVAEVRRILDLHGVRVVSFSTEYDLEGNQSTFTLGIRIANLSDETAVVESISGLPHIKRIRLIA